MPWAAMCSSPEPSNMRSLPIGVFGAAPAWPSRSRATPTRARVDLAARLGDIVHGRRDDIPAEDLSLLARIARELVRKELDFPYERNSALEGPLSAYEKAKKAGKQARGARADASKGG